MSTRPRRLAGIGAADLRALYAQHTEETGQLFTEEALDCAYELCAGQPWLTNALAHEVVHEMRVAPPEAITAEHLQEAKERLILARATHLDSLAARLHEERVRRVLEPLIAGSMAGVDATYDDAFSYVVDLGLVAPDAPLRMANPIYREVVVRVLASGAEKMIALDPRSFVLRDGRLDMDRLLREFLEFWCEHGEILTRSMVYHEVAPQLVLMAFLQRVVNCGGTVDREYGVGRGRIDLLVSWPYADAGRRQREALELKVWRDGTADPLGRGLVQLDEYLQRLGLDRGVLVLFDRRSSAPPITERSHIDHATTASGRAVTLVRA